MDFNEFVLWEMPPARLSVFEMKFEIYNAMTIINLKEKREIYKAIANRYKVKFDFVRRCAYVMNRRKKKQPVKVCFKF
jgi:hypothetical protein